MEKPRIVLFDLETLPNLQEALKVWPQLSQYPGKTLRATVSTIACAGYKFLDEKKVYCINSWDYKNWDKDVNDDSEVCKRLAEVLSKADAVVTHNGKRFDWRFLQTRLKKNNIPFLLHNTPHIDTKQEASKHLYAFNNKLTYLGEQFVGDKKLDHEGWDLWVKVHGRDPAALNKMERYCKQDVRLLEKLYLELRPLISSIPNHNLWLDTEKEGNPKKICSSCGSKRLRSYGWRHTKTQSYRRFRCIDCHSFGRADKKEKNLRSL